MAAPSHQELTELLNQWAEGNREVFDRILPLVYDRLHLIARKRLSSDRDRQHFETTELLNEALIHLLKGQLPNWINREHFFAFAATAMRNILVDLQRKSNAKKRGAGKVVSLEDREIAGDNGGKYLDFIILDGALEKLERVHPRLCRIIELSEFLGMTNEEIAEILRISISTVKRDIKTARTYLKSEVSSNEEKLNIV